MAEFTATRKELRRAICRAARMGFYTRYSADEIALTGTQSTTQLVSTSLTQRDNFWTNAWAYIASGTQLGNERRVVNYSSGSHALTLEYPLSSAPSAADTIELLNLFSAADIHAAINRSIRETGRIFFDSRIDSSLVLQEDKVSYTISGLTVRPWRINRIRVERAGNSTLTGVVDSATSSSPHARVVDASAFTTNDQYNGQKISIYAGTGAGQIGTIVDTVASGTYVTVLLTEFVTLPDSTSKYRIWNPSQESLTPYDIREITFDAGIFPDTMYFNRLLPSLYGYRIFIYYDALPTELSADTDTTIVPKEFIINQSLAYLHETILSDNRADSNRHANAAQMYRRLADEYKMRYATSRPVMSQWIDENPGRVTDIEDPLDWGV